MIDCKGTYSSWSVLQHDVEPQVLSLARARFPREAFGFFLCHGTDKLEVREAVVKADSHRFFVQPQHLIDLCYECEQKGYGIVGTFHSHPDGRNDGFSEADRMLFHWGKNHLVYVFHKQSKEWQACWHSRMPMSN